MSGGEVRGGDKIEWRPGEGEAIRLSGREGGARRCTKKGEGGERRKRKGFQWSTFKGGRGREGMREDERGGMEGDCVLQREEK